MRKEQICFTGGKVLLFIHLERFLCGFEAVRVRTRVFPIDLINLMHYLFSNILYLRGFHSIKINYQRLVFFTYKPQIISCIHVLPDNCL